MLNGNHDFEHIIHGISMVYIVINYSNQRGIWRIMMDTHGDPKPPPFFEHLLFHGPQYG
jgi:hypothetical protein